MEDVPQALADIGASYYLNSVQYEDETELIHYEWVVEVADDAESNDSRV